MKGDLRCIAGRIYRHDPQSNDPDFETDIGQCPDCSGDGCGDDGESVAKLGRSQEWLRDSDYKREFAYSLAFQDACDNGETEES